MSKVLVSIVAACLALGGVVAGGFVFSGKSSGLSSRDLTSIRDDLTQVRADLQSLVDEVRRVRENQDTLAHRRALAATAAATQSAGATGVAAPATVAEPESGEIADVVAAVIAEERRQQEEERERLSAERRERFEERRRELEAMEEGPYDRYNLKVNSLGRILNLTEAQKQAYFNLASGYRTRMEEEMTRLRTAQQAESAAAAAEGEGEGGEDRGRGRGGRGGRGGGREAYRELAENLQNEFTTAVQGILSVEQFQTYGELSRSAQSYQSLEMVSTDGDGGRSGDRFGGGRGGFGDGASGFGGGGRRGR